MSVYEFFGYLSWVVFFAVTFLFIVRHIWDAIHRGPFD